MEKFYNTHNPIAPAHIHIPDAEAHVFSDGKLYLYGSYDISDVYYCSGEYHVLSTSDMKNWTFHDKSLDVAELDWVKGTRELVLGQLKGVTNFEELPKHLKNSLPEEAKQMPFEDLLSQIADNVSANLGDEKLLYAPDAIEKDGKYYLYFCCSDGSEGVAVSDKPEGPFTNPKKLEADGIDPAIFIDDDGQAYYYWAQFESKGAKLTEDMHAIQQDTVIDKLITEDEHSFHEGSSMRKRGDTYYYVFADISRGKPTSLGYATSKSPLGPFKYQGVIIDNTGCDPASWNNHGSIEEIDGQWYVFYHRSSRNTVYNRRVCCEKIYFDENGLIPEVKMTSQGAGEAFAKGETIEAYRACVLSGECFIAPVGDDECITNISEADTATFRYINTSGLKTMTINGKGRCLVEVLIDGKSCGKGELNKSIELDFEVQRFTREAELTLVFTECEDAAVVEVVL